MEKPSREHMLSRAYKIANELFAEEYADSFKALRSVYDGQLNDHAKMRLMAEIFQHHARRHVLDCIAVAVMFVIATDGELEDGDIPDHMYRVLARIVNEGEGFLEHLVTLSCKDGEIDSIKQVVQIYEQDKKVYTFASKIVDEAEKHETKR